jgi:hypothetical protein
MMQMKTDIDATLDKISTMAMQLENRIDDLAMIACKAGNPRAVHAIMVEHDKLHRMVIHLNRIALGNLSF